MPAIETYISQSDATKLMVAGLITPLDASQAVQGRVTFDVEAKMAELAARRVVAPPNTGAEALRYADPPPDVLPDAPPASAQRETPEAPETTQAPATSKRRYVRRTKEEIAADEAALAASGLDAATMKVCSDCRREDEASGDPRRGYRPLGPGPEGAFARDGHTGSGWAHYCKRHQAIRHARTRPRKRVAGEHPLLPPKSPIARGTPSPVAPRARAARPARTPRPASPATSAPVQEPAGPVTPAEAERPQAPKPSNDWIDPPWEATPTPSVRAPAPTPPPARLPAIPSSGTLLALWPRLAPTEPAAPASESRASATPGGDAGEATVRLDANTEGAILAMQRAEKRAFREMALSKMPAFDVDWTETQRARWLRTLHEIAMLSCYGAAMDEGGGG